jgi:hypothetical protein
MPGPQATGLRGPTQRCIPASARLPNSPVNQIKAAPAAPLAWLPRRALPWGGPPGAAGPHHRERRSARRVRQAAGARRAVFLGYPIVQLAGGGPRTPNAVGWARAAPGVAGKRWSAAHSCDGARRRRRGLRDDPRQVSDGEYLDHIPGLPGSPPPGPPRLLPAARRRSAGKPDSPICAECGFGSMRSPIPHCGEVSCFPGYHSSLNRPELRLNVMPPITNVITSKATSK